MHLSWTSISFTSGPSEHEAIMKILITDDDFTSRKMIQNAVSEFGSCDFAMDGKEAVYAFKLAMKEHEPYDLIFLDIMMPEMDGYEVLETIRNLESKRGIAGDDAVKIIMETALDDPKNIMDAFKSQCEAYITKPLDKRIIIEKMRELRLLD